MRMFKKDEGFTLVELMVVVLIIGILVAVAIPVFNSASASARKRACQANLRTLDGAVEQWASANPLNAKYLLVATTAPTADVVLTDLGNSASYLNATDAGQGLTGNYVKDWAKSTQCPAGGAGSGSEGYTLTFRIANNSVSFLCDYPSTSPGGVHTYP